VLLHSAFALEKLIATIKRTIELFSWNAKMELRHMFFQIFLICEKLSAIRTWNSISVLQMCLFVLVRVALVVSCILTDITSEFFFPAPSVPPQYAVANLHWLNKLWCINRRGTHDDSQHELSCAFSD
jgi:hypothetical protein